VDVIATCRKCYTRCYRLKANYSKGMNGSLEPVTTVRAIALIHIGLLAIFVVPF
jgi:hypothetical protein